MAARAATERYRDVDVALADRYIRDQAGMCEAAEMMGRPAGLGAMSIHFVTAEFLALTEPADRRIAGIDTHIDFRNPSILI